MFYSKGIDTEDFAMGDMIYFLWWFFMCL